ncbi:cytidylyltransferase domain-containing protein [Actinokineospora fastidiosa]|nr:glycosyltransferase family protein [Actinokineospora fastidiosa]
MASVRVNAVIQARMSSTRLPGKVLRDLGGRPVLDWVVRAAHRAAVDRVIVATSDDPSDDPIALAADAEVVRGPLDDVLARFLMAADRFPCDAVLRLTADCPLLDPGVLDQVVGLWRADPSVDYVSNTLVRTMPRGYDAEVVRTDVLFAQAAVPDGPHREHVTSGVYTDPRYRCAGVVASPDASDLRVTLDTPEDAAVIETVVAALGEPRMRDVVAYLRAHPSVAARNAHVEQASP